MKRKQLTDFTLKKNSFGLHGLYTNISALQELIDNSTAVELSSSFTCEPGECPLVSVSTVSWVLSAISQHWEMITIFHNVGNYEIEEIGIA